MTEEEWLASESPVALLNYLNADGYSRKVLLYASALCSLRADLLTQNLHDWSAQVEAVLLDVASPSSLNNLQESAESVVGDLADHGPIGTRAFYLTLADVIFCTWGYEPVEDETGLLWTGLRPMRQIAVGFVRDIYGNPFRPVSFSPQWRTSTAVLLAEEMYATRNFSAMPILADALQDAGCDNDDILSHCRDTSLAHVRGCWVVDLVLGKFG